MFRADAEDLPGGRNPSVSFSNQFPARPSKSPASGSFGIPSMLTSYGAMALMQTQQPPQGVVPQMIADVISYEQFHGPCLR